MEPESTKRIFWVRPVFSLAPCGAVLGSDLGVPCYHPVKAYDIGLRKNGKRDIVFGFRYRDEGVEVPLPCGKCIGCQLERARQWAVRCVHEASLYDKNCFLTLTYSPEFLPEGGSLNLRDFQLFMKRLRKDAGSGIRFFHAGEYGEEFSRPHYHAIIFNYDFDDKVLASVNGGNKLYISQKLRDLWPLGHSTIGEVTTESACYVARYSLKKVRNDEAEKHYKGRSAEYVTMSRRPGIGKGWFDQFKTDVYPSNSVITHGREVRPPRFYDKLLERSSDFGDKLLFSHLKDEREESARRRIALLTKECGNVDMIPMRLKEMEKVKLAQIRQLKRNLEEN